MNLHRVIALAAASVLLGGAPISAHHSFGAEFDASKPVQLRGTVVKVEWINPHSWIHIDVKQPDGTAVRWMIEGGTPNTLLRNGLKRDSLPVGTEIVVDGYRAKNGTNRANGRDLTFPDGRKLFVGSSGTGAPWSCRMIRIRSACSQVKLPVISAESLISDRKIGAITTRSSTKIARRFPMWFPVAVRIFCVPSAVHRTATAYSPGVLPTTTSACSTSLLLTTTSS